MADNDLVTETKTFEGNKARDGKAEGTGSGTTWSLNANRRKQQIGQLSLD